MNEGPIWGRGKADRDTSSYGWIRGTLEGDSAHFEDGRVVARSTIENEMDIYRGNVMSPLELEDLGMLTHLNEPSMVHCLDERFQSDKVYCHTGDMLLAVNPFKTIPKLYDIAKFQTQHQSTSSRVPHVFTTAHETYRALHGEQRKNQTVLVSGESGSGKTETTKFIMQYLAVVSGSAGSKDKISISEQVLQSNPILESFGNARTLRNDNSSRFGKFVKIWFAKDGHDTLRLIGTSIETYLLEKVRLVRQAAGERNFHIFYELLAGAKRDRALQTKLHLFGSPTEFAYLNQSGCYERRDNVSDEETFEKTMRAMAIVGFSDEEQTSILELVASLLHLGNLRFGHKAGGGSGGSDATLAEIESPQMLAWVAELLAVDVTRLRNVLTNRQIKAKDEWYVVHLTKEQAEDARDAMARSIYGYLFDWLVFKVNQCVGAHEVDNGYSNDFAFIGVLDIFGFESFETNSFEQLCINYANERLQHHFIDFVMTQEQGRYQREGIPWTLLELPQNEGCLEVLEGRPTGVLALLDEECNIPKGTDAGFVRKLYQLYPNHAHFQASKRDQVEKAFVVVHYAGAVRYAAEGFCEKNRDKPHQAIFDLLTSSTSNFVRVMCRPVEDVVVPMLRRKSSIVSTGLGAQFRRQLQHLLDMITQTQPHYIRCLKPNDQNKKQIFDKKRMADQLRYGGVLEAVTISRLGYPVHMAHASFVARYLVVLTPKPKSQPSVDSLLQLLVTKLGSMWPLREANNPTTSKWFVYGMEKGKTLVFLRQTTYDFLEEVRNRALYKRAVTVQAFAKMAFYRDQFLRMKEAASNIQRLTRGHFARQLRRQMLARRTVARWIQATYRGREARRVVLAMRKERAAIRMQTQWRMWTLRLQYRKMLKKTLIIQCAWRCRQAIQHVKQLKKEALSLQHTIVERNQLRQELYQTKNEANLAKQRAKEAEEELRRVKQLLLEMQRGAATMQLPSSVVESGMPMNTPVALLDNSSNSPAAHQNPAMKLVEDIKIMPPIMSTIKSTEESTHPTEKSMEPDMELILPPVAPVLVQTRIENPIVEQIISTDEPLQPSIHMETCIPHQTQIQTPKEEPATIVQPTPVCPTKTPAVPTETNIVEEHRSEEQSSPAELENFFDASAVQTPRSRPETHVSQPQDVESLKVSPQTRDVDEDSKQSSLKSEEAETSLLNVDPTEEETKQPPGQSTATVPEDWRGGPDEEHLQRVPVRTHEAHVEAHHPAVKHVQQQPLTSHPPAQTEVVAAAPVHENKPRFVDTKYQPRIPERRASTFSLLSNLMGHYADVSFDVEDIKMALERGESPDLQDASGRTMLHFAVEMDNIELVDLLLQHHASVTIADYTTQETAFHIAAKMANMEISGIFCRPDVFDTLDVNLPDKEGNTVLHLACASGRPQAAFVLELYLALGADPNMQNVLGRTPLHICTLLRRDDLLVERLLAFGADPNVYSIDKKTPLHIAAKRGLLNQAKQLVKHGASMNLPDGNESRVIFLDVAKDLRRYLGTYPPVKIPDEAVASCMVCDYGFNFLVRRHHCHRCGAICCSDCIENLSCRLCRASQLDVL
ncbi:hypothetical protein AeMF1_011554 [Aphanomyces euteiches]|nr:hypothetical protein AeMF1_011554 [Aphanomyces euteiches]KAH9196384.1 hypothetical protein AeNC1_001641 [Aphanomyces euteiches]